MRNQYIRNSLMVTSMCFAISNAYGMEPLEDQSSQGVKKSISHPMHSPDKWNSHETKNYNKKISIEIEDLRCFGDRYRYSHEDVQEKYLSMIEFRAKNLFNMQSLFIGQKGSSEDDSSFVILITGNCLNSSFLEKARKEGSLDPAIQEKFDKELDNGFDHWENAHVEDFLAQKGYNKTERDKDWGRNLYSSHLNSLKKKLAKCKTLATQDLEKEYGKKLSGGTDIEKKGPSCYQNDPQAQYIRYQYTYPFNYSYQSSNKAEIAEFLSLFYEKDMIPDFFIPKISTYMGIEDFRKGEKIKFALNLTGYAQDVTVDKRGTRVITDNNAHASYQLESDRFDVMGGQKIKILYDIVVEDNGIMSLGLLNTARNGWYGEELILKTGNYRGTYEREVPYGEAQTSLVFRNYQGILEGGPGQTTFTIKKADLYKK